MGIMDFVKGGIRELAIARPDEAKSLVVYKHPDPTIPNRAQLTVEADEVALFFKDGKFIGLLPPGRHKMETDNIPFLGQLVDWGTGGNVWISEVYFVTTRELAGHKFGGKIGKILDPQSRIPIELMVNGTYSFKVVDPTKLVIGLVGLQRTSNEEFLAWFRDQVLKTIKDDIAELCVKKKWPLLDVTSGAYTEEVITEVLAGIRQHVDPYGIEIMGIGNFNLAMSQTDEERLNKIFDNAAYMNMAGGVQGYQQMAAASAMMDAGAAMKNASTMPGGGGGNPLMQGAGLGIGMAMAGQFMHGGQGAPQGVPAGAAAMAGAAPALSQTQLKTELQQAAQLLREMDIKAALAILDRLVQTL